MISLNEFLKRAIYEICEEENILLKTFSKDWIFRLEKNNIHTFITGFKFPNNTLATADICNDKVALFEVLSNLNVPCVEHFPVFLSDYPEIEDSFFLELLEKYGTLLVKDNRGSCGKNIYKCVDVKAMRENIEKLFLSEYLVAISPFINIEAEYRLIMLNGELQVIYGKRIKEVIGDGVKSIRELCIDKDIENKFLDEVFLDLVLEKNESRKLDFQHNLSRYGEFFKVEDEAFKQQLLDIAKTVVDYIGIKFASVDIVMTEGVLKVLEVNSGVMMENYGKDENFAICKEVYRKAILSNFI